MNFPLLVEIKILPSAIRINKNKILRVTQRETLNINITKISGNYSKMFAAPSLSRNSGIEKNKKNYKNNASCKQIVIKIKQNNWYANVVYAPRFNALSLLVVNKKYLSFIGFWNASLRICYRTHAIPMRSIASLTRSRFGEIVFFLINILFANKSFCRSFLLCSALRNSVRSDTSRTEQRVVLVCCGWLCR